jgi:hypothetical protein
MATDKESHRLGSQYSAFKSNVAVGEETFLSGEERSGAAVVEDEFGLDPKWKNMNWW